MLAADRTDNASQAYRPLPAELVPVGTALNTTSDTDSS